jgi:hypothetical protein
MPYTFDLIQVRRNFYFYIIFIIFALIWLNLKLAGLIICFWFFCLSDSGQAWEKCLSVGPGTG